jgi:hypothetical protein
MAVSTLFYRSCSSIILFSPSDLEACALFRRMQPRTIAISSSIARGYSSGTPKGVMAPIRRFTSLALKANHFRNERKASRLRLEWLLARHSKFGSGK